MVYLKDLNIVVLYGILSGVIGTGTGGLIACFLPAQNKCIISFLLQFSAGLMLSIVCFDLLPSAFRFAPFSLVLISIIMGILIMLLSEELITAKGKKNSMTTGISITLGISIHHFLEGMAVGSGFVADEALGVSLLIAVMLHNIPEGISIAVPLRVGGMKPAKAFMLALAAGLPTGLGALLGSWISQDLAAYISMPIAVAGGAMLYIVFLDMLDESKRMYDGKLSSFGSIIGMISGLIVCFRFG